MPDDALVLLLMLTAGLCLAGNGAVVALLLYATARRAGRPLLPPVRPVRPGPSGGIVVGIFVVFVLVTPVVQTLLARCGFFATLYGPDFPIDLPDKATAAQKAASTLRYLWASAFGFPMTYALIVGLVRRRTRPAFAPNAAAMNGVAGYLTWLLVTPAALIVFVLANNVHTWLTGQLPDKHPLTLLGETAGRIEWALFAVQAIVFAPVLEEMVFRGVLLSWLMKKESPENRPDEPFALAPSLRGGVVFLVAFAIAVEDHRKDWFAAVGAGDAKAVAVHTIPAAFVLALVPLYFVLPKLRRLRRHLRIRSPRHVQGIVASSALFAAFHSAVWPSPVPLVVLALAIGYLYARTRSVVGPIVVHGMFNAVSVVYLWLGGPA